ncbi:protein kinase, partial [Planctomycetota bacterium]
RRLPQARQQAEVSLSHPGYEFIKKLGEGGMGDVYLARQKSMERLVAVKILPSRLMKDKEFVDRFLREARLAGKIEHVNVVRGLDAGEHTGHHYFVMEYVEGKPLDELIPKGGALEEEYSLHICMQIARALGYAGKLGIIHRDVKPSNILVTSDGIAKLCDMGLAKHLDAESQMTLSGITMGTPHYMSPEQARGDKSIDTRADIYSLGATLYHLVTGEPPFSGSSAAVVLTKHLTEEIPWPRDINSKVSENCCYLIEKMMAKDRKDRFKTAEELLADMEFVIDGKGLSSGTLQVGRSSVARAGAVKVKPRPRVVRAEHGAHPWLIWSIAAGVFVVFLIVLLASRGEKEKPPPAGEPAEVVEEVRPTETPDTLKEMFEYAQKWAKDHPEDFDGGIAKYEMLKKSADGTVWEMRSIDAIGGIGAAREKAASKAFAKIERRAKALAAKGDYDGAVAACRKLPGKFRSVLAARAGDAAAKLKAEVEGNISKVLASAEQLSKEGEPDGGIAELDGLAGVKYASLADKITAMRARLQDEKKNVAETAKRKAEAAAKKKVEETWAAFDEKVLAGDYKAASLAVTQARRDPKVKDNSSLGALVALADEIEKLRRSREKAKSSIKKLIGQKVTLDTVKGARTGTVRKIENDVIELLVDIKAEGIVAQTTNKIELEDLTPGQRAKLIPSVEPTTPGGWLAHAVLVMGEMSGKKGKADASVALLSQAEAGLARAEGHTLAPHYKEQLDILKMGEAEAYAKMDWDKLIKPLLAVKKFEEKEAESAQKVLDGYREKHAGKKFIKTVEKDIVALEDKIGEVLGGLTLANVKKLFHGEVRKFDPKTCEIELFYDFEDPRQIEDWHISTPKAWTISDGKLKAAKVSTVSTMLSEARFVETLSISRAILPSSDYYASIIITGTNRGAESRWDGLYWSLYKGTGKTENIVYTQRMKQAWSGPFPQFKLPAEISASYERGRLRTSINRSQVCSIEYSLRSPLYYGFVTHSDGETIADNLHITGTLDRDWLLTELAMATPVKVKPGQAATFKKYKAVWRKMNPKGLTRDGKSGELPRSTPGFNAKMKDLCREYSGSAYDRKRQLCIMYGVPGYNKPGKNDIWAYDSEQNSWTCLEPDDPGADGKRRPKGWFSSPHYGGMPFAYDPVNDAYWLPAQPTPKTWEFWYYRPETRSFTRGIQVQGGDLRVPEGVGVCPIGYCPSLRSLVTPWEVIDLRTMKRRKLKSSVPRTVVYVWSFPSARSSGGLKLAAENGAFLVFGGGSPATNKGQHGVLSETLHFDPVRDTWTELKPKASPPRRYCANLVYDAALKIWVLFSGMDNKRKSLRDTWVYAPHLNTWLELTPKTGQSPPFNGPMWYDEARDLVVLFTQAGETWTCKIIPVK